MKTQVIDIQSITPDMVVRAYVGKPGCMCGCKGKYYRNVPAPNGNDSGIIDARDGDQDPQGPPGERGSRRVRRGCIRW
jgi:hypothetical protein